MNDHFGPRTAVVARPPYGRDDLAALIAPRSIAVVGASDRKGSLGARAMANLEHFDGNVYPVSARLKTLGRWQCFATVADLPEPPDCVVLAIPADAIEAALGECVAAGAKSAVVFASGYAEIGTAEGIAAQARLAAIARDSGMRIVGPNTTGIANLISGAHCGFAEFPHGYAASGRSIAVVAQSGAMSLSFSQAAEHGVSISHVLTSGNACDIDVSDYVNALADDPAVNAIALAFEGLAYPERLEEAALRARTAGKPIVCLKVGNSAAGAAAARWHTGSEAGHRDDWNGLFARCGIVPMASPAGMMETAVFLAKTRAMPRPQTPPPLAILSSSGGLGILAADVAEAAGLPIQQPGNATSTRLAAAIPAFGSPRNPCDATAQATSNPQSLVDCADILLGDPAYGALILPWGKAWRSPAFEGLEQCARRHRKPICLVWLSQWHEGPGAREAEMLDGVCVFRSLESCMAALLAWSGAQGLAQVSTNG